MKVPYATCDFAAIRQEAYFYVDKTPFLPHLENLNEKHIIFLRPRRFGKSTLISLLQNYYDINKADRFDELFRGLWVHEHPTESRHKYLVLTLDLSPVDTTGTMDRICSSFAVQIKSAVLYFIGQYEHLVPSLRELNGIVRSDDQDMAGLITAVLTRLQQANRQMYLLMDEYDHFGNRLLSDGREDAYQQLIASSGFVRSFYAALKAFTLMSTIARTFITGVSPIMLDDLSSGFNIISHISQDDVFNELAGFTRADVGRAIDVLLAEKPELAEDPRIGDRDALLEVLERHYDGYRFSRRAKERIYNSTLVWHFFRMLLKEGQFPSRMLDLNVRTDYGRLYQLTKTTSEHVTDTRDLLEEILTKESITVPLVEQFGTKMHLGRAQVASLFYYMGMLTLAEDSPTGEVVKLVIPNRVMRELQWEYMSYALSDHDGLRFDMSALQTATISLGFEGEIQPLLDVFKKDVLNRLGLRESLKFDEKTLKLMLFAYLSQSKAFYLMTEKEFAQGYCDLLLGVRGPGSGSKYAWIIEAKYVKTKASTATIDKQVREGYAQIEKYVNDQDIMKMLTLGREWRAGVLVFVGLKDVRFFPWPVPEKKETKKRKRVH